MKNKKKQRHIYVYAHWKEFKELLENSNIFLTDAPLKRYKL